MSIDLWNKYKDRGILAAPYDIAKSILHAHNSADTPFTSYYAKESASHAAIGAAESVSQGYDKEYQIAKDLETRWQIRRFVDCIEAIQARKPWPRLEDTE